jgi:hypothetical protein
MAMGQSQKKIVSIKKEPGCLLRSRLTDVTFSVESSTVSQFDHFKTELFDHMMASRLTTAPTVELLRQVDACRLSRYDLVGTVIHDLTNDWYERWEGLVALFAALRDYDLEERVAGRSPTQSSSEKDFDFKHHIVFDNVLEDSDILDAFLNAGMRLNKDFGMPKHHSADRYGVQMLDVWYWTLRSGADHVSKRCREAGDLYFMTPVVSPKS